SRGRSARRRKRAPARRCRTPSAPPRRKGEEKRRKGAAARFALFILYNIQKRAAAPFLSEARKARMAAPVSFSRWLAGSPTTRAMLPVACAKSKDAETARDAFSAATGALH